MLIGLVLAGISASFAGMAATTLLGMGMMPTLMAYPLAGTTGFLLAALLPLLRTQDDHSHPVFEPRNTSH